MKNSRRMSRRLTMKNGFLLAVGAVTTLATATVSKAQEKIAQTQVQYQTTPKDGAKCSLCVNWVAPNACKIVDGTINPEGWCVAFAPKEG